MPTEEQARFEKAVQAEVEKRLATQQAEVAKAMEQAIKASLNHLDKGREILETERMATLIEREKQINLQKEAEDKAEILTEQFFYHKQAQFREAAQTALLRELVIKHLKEGKTMRDVAIWLDVPMDFVKNIHAILERKKQYSEEKPLVVPDGNPKLRFQDYGRGGTIWYETVDGSFDMWWEFAGGDALVIVDIPTREQWVERTKISLHQRNKVLTYIAEQILRDKNNGAGSYIIGHNVITFYD